MSPLEEDRHERVRAVVHGRVQGVGFRDYVYRRARFMGLTGYVQNLADGRSVEVVAEGPRHALKQLVEYLSEGPRMSRVDSVQTEWGEAFGAYPDFGIGY